MKKSHGFIGIALLVILAIAIVGGVTYVAVNKSKTNTISDQEQQVAADNFDFQLFDEKNEPEKTSGNTVDVTQEMFKNQPGGIKSIKNTNGKYIVAVDILNPNTKWVPGSDTSGDFFINENLTLRNLEIDNSTIIKNCSMQQSDTASQFENNLKSFESRVNKAITEPDYSKFGYTAYFDITGSKVTTIYEQCLP
jgi:hypothetical protein